MEKMQQPLLQQEGGDESWSSYQYVGRTASFNVPAAGGEQISVDEIRSASVLSDHYYPPSIHSALVTAPDSDRFSDPSQGKIELGLFVFVPKLLVWSASIRRFLVELNNLLCIFVGQAVVYQGGYAACAQGYPSHQFGR